MSPSANPSLGPPTDLDPPHPPLHNTSPTNAMPRPSRHEPPPTTTTAFQTPQDRHPHHLTTLQESHPQALAALRHAHDAAADRDLKASLVEPRASSERGRERLGALLSVEVRRREEVVVVAGTAPAPTSTPTTTAPSSSSSGPTDDAAAPTAAAPHIHFLKTGITVSEAKLATTTDELGQRCVRSAIRVPTTPSSSSAPKDDAAAPTAAAIKAPPHVHFLTTGISVSEAKKATTNELGERCVRSAIRVAVQASDTAPIPTSTPTPTTPTPKLPPAAPHVHFLTTGITVSEAKRTTATARCGLGQREREGERWVRSAVWVGEEEGEEEEKDEKGDGE